MKITMSKLVELGFNRKEFDVTRKVIERVFYNLNNNHKIDKDIFYDFNYTTGVLTRNNRFEFSSIPDVIEDLMLCSVDIGVDIVCKAVY